MPTVSVVVPAYNHTQYVRQCLDSVLAQTYQDFEIVVVDDGSTDGTVEILREYRDRIILIEQTNQGTQAARNAGIRASSGKYIALLDSDDLWLPHKLERQLAILQDHPEISLVYGQAYLVDSYGNGLNQGRPFGAPLENPAWPFEQILISNPVPALTAVVRTSCLDEIGLFDEKLVGAGDWELWLRLAAKWQFAYIAQPLAVYRVHDANTTKLLYRTKLVYAEHRLVLEKASALQLSQATSVEVWNQAWAQAHIIAAEAEVLSGNLTAASTELAKALALDPELPNSMERNGLTYRLAEWAHMYCEKHRETAAYQAFSDGIFSQVTLVTHSIERLKRKSLSIAAVGAAFLSHSSGEFAAVRSLLWLGVRMDPTCMSNRGVWSIASDAFLGSSAAHRLRQWVKNLNV